MIYLRARATYCRRELFSEKFKLKPKQWLDKRQIVIYGNKIIIHIFARTLFLSLPPGIKLVFLGVGTNAVSESWRRVATPFYSVTEFVSLYLRTQIRSSAEIKIRFLWWFICLPIITLHKYIIMVWLFPFFYILLHFILFYLTQKIKLSCSRWRRFFQNGSVEKLAINQTRRLDLIRLWGPSPLCAWTIISRRFRTRNK